MKTSTHSILRAGLSLLTASAVVFALSVQPAPPPRPAPTVQLVASVQPLALPPQPPLLSVLLNSPLALLGPAAPLGTLPPAPAPLAIPIAPNLANTIDGIYTAVEPWVEYGFAVATSIVRWIPYVGWFAGQIMVFYEFGESMVASGVFNFTDWLRGNGSFAENLVDFGIDVGLAFVWLGLDEVAQFVPLPPFCCYPPRPPVQGPFLALETQLGPTETDELMMSAASVEESEADAVEQLGEDLGEGDVAEGGGVESDPEEGVETDDLANEDTTETTTDSSGSGDVQGEIDESDIEATTDEDADDAADAAEGEIGENSETADTPDPTTEDNTAETGNENSAEGDSGAE